MNYNKSSQPEPAKTAADGSRFRETLEGLFKSSDATGPSETEAEEAQTPAGGFLDRFAAWVRTDALPALFLVKQSAPKGVSVGIRPFALGQAHVRDLDHVKLLIGSSVNGPNVLGALTLRANEKLCCVEIRSQVLRDTEEWPPAQEYRLAAHKFRCVQNGTAEPIYSARISAIDLHGVIIEFLAETLEYDK